MKTVKIIIIAALLIPFVNCCTSKYPQLEVYKPDYLPGTNINLHLNGYYDHSVEIYYRNSVISDLVQPLFFFEDGSFCYDFSGIIKTRLAEVLNTSKTNYLVLIEHLTWGNYKIDGDTIIMESLQWSQGYFNSHYRCNIQKGIIHKDSICIFESNDKCLNNRTLKFYAFDLKPDSTLNWIRKDQNYIKREN